MYKTVWLMVWLIDDRKLKTELTYYHFGKEPKFPSWCMEEGIVYEIEMAWNLKLVYTPKMFFKCLFREWMIR